MAYTTTTVGSLLELARTCREVVLPEACLCRISESVATAAQDVPVTALVLAQRLENRIEFIEGTGQCDLNDDAFLNVLVEEIGIVE